MLSKTSSTRFWRYAALIAFTAVAQVGCGGGGGGTDGGGGQQPIQDTTPPRFSGLQTAELNSSTGQVEVTAAEASDNETPKAELSYLIYVSDQLTVDKNTVAPQTFTGAGACINGQCRFPLTGLKTDGSATYRFASNVRDSGGHIDADAHPNEGGLTITPQSTTVQPPGGGNGGGGTGDNIIASASLNVDKTKNAVHPTLAVVNDQRYVTWEECVDDIGTVRDANDVVTRKAPDGWEDNHPCAFNTKAQIYIKQGANWDLVTDPDPALGGRSDLTRNPDSHAHNPTLAFNGTTLYSAWKEMGIGAGSSSNLFLRTFATASGWADTAFPDSDSDDRPALTRHPALEPDLGMAFERSPAGQSAKHLLFQKYNGVSWLPAGSPLNKVSTFSAEAPVFSKKGDLFIAWKEATQAPPLKPIPNIFVKRWNGSGWDDVAGGQALNLDSKKEARFPSIDVLDNVPYVAWHECFDTDCNREHIFVKRLEGNQWVQVKDTGICGEGATADQTCGSLNVNSRFAKTPSLAVFNGKVYVAWSERDFKTNKWAVHIKRLDGDKWTELKPQSNIFVKNAQSPMLYANGSLNIAWVEENGDVLQLIVAKIG